MGLNPPLDPERDLVFGEIDLHPALDLPDKSSEGVFSGLRREISLAGIIEGSGIVFKLLRKLLKENKTGAIEGEIEFRNRPIGAASFRDVILKASPSLHVTAKNSTHKERIISHILLQGTLLEELGFVGRFAGLGGEHFDHAIHFPAPAGANSIQIVAFGEIGEHIRDIPHDGRVVYAQLPEAPANDVAKKAV